MKRISAYGAALMLTGAAFVWAQQEQQPERPDRPKPARADKPANEAIGSSKQFIEKYDKDRDGFLQREELPAEMRESFIELDLNKDGKLSMQELEKHAAIMRKHPRHQPVEMITIWIVEHRDAKVGREDLQKAYDFLRMLDRDQNGQLTANEFALAQSAAAEAKLKAMLACCDKNKDGRISRDEAEEHVGGNRFSMYDRNLDGFLDRSEIEQAMKEQNEPAAPAAGPRQSDAKEVERTEKQNKDDRSPPVDR